MVFQLHVRENMPKDNPLGPANHLPTILHTNPQPQKICSLSHGRDSPPSECYPGPNSNSYSWDKKPGKQLPSTTCPYDPCPPYQMLPTANGCPNRWDELEDLGTLTNDLLPGLEDHAPPLHRPVSSKQLYGNLLHLVRNRIPSPSLPALLDYHDLFPQLQSTKSYNFLISLTLRHAAFGTGRSLFSKMSAAGISPNLETQKLKTRYLVETGWWHQLWKQPSRTRQPYIDSIQNSPLPILIEFFRVAKRGSLRRRCRSSPILHSMSSREESTRLQVLLTALLKFVPEKLIDLPARVLRLLITLLLHSNQSQQALAITRSYFQQLPNILHPAHRRFCLDIIHLHLALGSAHQGLRRLYEQRRLLYSLLAHHSSFNPNSTTLYILLSGLKRSKRCGTVAWSVLRQFKKQWKKQIEDQRVRRRVISLALKEGRLDIVAKLWESEQRWRRDRMTRNLIRLCRATRVPYKHRLLRPSTRTKFKGNGKERYIWRKLQSRIYQAGLKTQQKEN